MAIFHKASSIAESAEDIADSVSNFINAVDAVVDGAANVLGKTKGILKRFRRLVGKAKDAVNAVATVLKRNPALRGPWRILANIAAFTLNGVAKVLGAIEAIVGFLSRILSSKGLKKLLDLLKKASDKLVDANILIRKVGRYADTLRRIADRLKKQQPALEKKYPSLKSLNKPLGDVEKTMKVVEGYAKDMDKAAKSIDNVLAGIKNIFANMNILDRMVGAVVGAISSVLTRVKNWLKRIADFIENIPGIGWFVSVLRRAINWAMDKLGIRRLFEALGQQIKKLPFFKKIAQYLDAIKAAVADVEKWALGLVGGLLDEIKKYQEVLVTIENLIKQFLGLDVKKIVHEFALPAWADRLRERIQKLRSAAEEKKTAKLRKDVADVNAQIRKMGEMVNWVSGSPISFEHEAMVQEAVGRLLDVVATDEEANDIDDNYFEVMDAELGRLSTPMDAWGIPKMPRKYFQEAINEVYALGEIEDAPWRSTVDDFRYYMGFALPGNKLPPHIQIASS